MTRLCTSGRIGVCLSIHVLSNSSFYSDCTRVSSLCRSGVKSCMSGRTLKLPYGPLISICSLPFSCLFYSLRTRIEHADVGVNIKQQPQAPFHPGMPYPTPPSASNFLYDRQYLHLLSRICYYAHHCRHCMYKVGSELHGEIPSVSHDGFESQSYFLRSFNAL